MLFPRYVDASSTCARFLDFQVGAPPQVASLLEEVNRERRGSPGAGAGKIGVDPELDEFMVCSCVSVVYMSIELEGDLAE
jgi:hypothetical protein